RRRCGARVAKRLSVRTKGCLCLPLVCLPLLWGLVLGCNGSASAGHSLRLAWAAPRGALGLPAVLTPEQLRPEPVGASNGERSQDIAAQVLIIKQLLEPPTDKGRIYSHRLASQLGGAKGDLL